MTVFDDLSAEQERLAGILDGLDEARLAEHWAHGMDITGPLSLDFPDTGRLRHVARLSVSGPHGATALRLVRTYAE
jgi:hypothetical protein